MKRSKEQPCPGKTHGYVPSSRSKMLSVRLECGKTAVEFLRWPSELFMEFTMLNTFTVVVSWV